MNNPFNFLKLRRKPKVSEKKEDVPINISAISPGRVSVPEDSASVMTVLKGATSMVTPTYRREVIELIRNLYKINPDVNIAIQDTFRLANTKHTYTFPDNTDEEADEMRDHLDKVTTRWSNYTAGIDGLVNKMIVQLLVGGAISVEAVPNQALDGLSTILFLKPENIYFKREANGVYTAYQKNTYQVSNNIREEFIKLNPETYIHAAMYNDTDEPYGIPPFMAAMDSIKGQQDMRKNFKRIMSILGMVGFLEAKILKPDRKASENEKHYEARLNKTLRDLKKNLRDGMADGIVTGYMDEAEFNLNSTSKELGNLDIPWKMNQQAVANGLGVSGTLLGLSQSTTEGGNGVILSKMISQLGNIQTIVAYVLKRIYLLELRLAGFKPHSVRITWGTSTISDEVKIQQARQYKVQNLDLLYKAGIISQYQYAWEMGYDSPDQEEPRLSLEDQNGVNTDPQEGTKKKQRQEDKNQSARRSRDKAAPVSKRTDQNPKSR